MVDCPICGKQVKERDINAHIDSGCQALVVDQSEDASKASPVSSFFQPQAAKRALSSNTTPKAAPGAREPIRAKDSTSNGDGRQDGASINGRKRSIEPENEVELLPNGATLVQSHTPAPKKTKLNALRKAAPLAERMRPRTLDEVCGQELVGPNGVIRGLIEQDRVPSMILWGAPGTGKTTIARLIANTAGTRFVEINSTSSGVGECKKLFAEARSELQLTGRKTIIFCDEIHRFSKSQQDVFLGPVEAGEVTLIGATTENPSFKLIDALLSRCRTFTLAKLTDENIITVLKRALQAEDPSSQPTLVDEGMIRYLAAFADGDARTALNLLELAMDLAKRPGMTQDEIKKSLTQTLVYDRAGDQHYDTISAFHKSIRGSDPDASLYYLARMLQSGEDPLYIARRLIIVASEDIGLADNSMLSLATAAYTACEKIGMPECRINLSHATVAMALSPKSTRVYRSLGNAMKALQEPGVAGLPVPVHLRNAPTKLMKELGYGKEYKYNPDYVDGKIAQDYLPDKLLGRRFLEERDLGGKVDLDLSVPES
ncbi:DNA-dependent ATPase mgs1 [Coniosporium tulheliwenetii]|uniref:DNA-dependent ATPase mgs1 n=1 Tax=Coniosporium tulheliwenetii TaxID=3383036 RepID=A0ACC2ZDS9_9PEZI|nr:DNA-dependent ATPase mgs1 [Cladosporium sp. JES 115]